MKILVIGDFHGKFTDKQFKELKKENPDVILSVGDFCGNKRWSKLFFEHFYAKSDREREKIPKKIKNELRRLEKLATEYGISVLKKLKKFDIPFYAVHGNWDPAPKGNDIFVLKDELPTKSELKRFHRFEGKNFEFIDFQLKDLGGFVLVGGTSSTYPGKTDKKSLLRSVVKWGIEGSAKRQRIMRMMKRNYEWRKRKFIQSFEKAKKLGKPTVFLTHNSPYGTKLDLIRDKKAHKHAKGKHYGSYLERLMINRFKPDLVLCGHIHENFGKQKLGESLVVNCGSAFEGDYVVVDFNEKTKKFKVKLKKLK